MIGSFLYIPKTDKSGICILNVESDSGTLHRWVAIDSVGVLIYPRKRRAVAVLHGDQAFVELPSELSSVHRDELHRVWAVKSLVYIHGMIEGKDGVERQRAILQSIMD